MLDAEQTTTLDAKYDMQYLGRKDAAVCVGGPLHGVTYPLRALTYEGTYRAADKLAWSQGGEKYEYERLPVAFGNAERTEFWAPKGCSLARLVEMFTETGLRRLAASATNVAYVYAEGQAEDGTTH